MSPADKTAAMRALPDVVRRGMIAEAANVVGHSRFLERARRVQVDMEYRRSGAPK